MIAGSASSPLAVVTGASRGIGYELSVLFAKNGFDLVVAAEDDGIAVTARQLEDHGGQALAVQADLATYAGVENLYLAISSLACPIAALAINASSGPIASDESTADPATADDGLAANLAANDVLAEELRLISRSVTATVYLTRRVLADMIGHNSGKILLTSPATEAVSVPYNATRAASNAFLRCFAETLSDELRDTPLTITAQVGHADGNDDPAKLARRGFDALMS